MKLLSFLVSIVIFSVVVNSHNSGWSEWADKPGARCNDTCGACGSIRQVRTCLGGNSKHCQGTRERLARCNFDYCLYPRQTCCAGSEKAIVTRKFQCRPCDD
ncbi:unnamed protein product [Caenorhabditis auriculariae]|uniref:Uncharacterized protein n=1 Tax=Caenorhabditis auriculariae TaxID=2777116 RepID=A0A8S1HRB7_9PELO|nr:unnamed protein product [Caenorhabditis auriculariae]